MKMSNAEKLKNDKSVSFVETQEDNVVSHFERATKITVYDDGLCTTYNKGDEKFEMVLDGILEMTKNSRPMPAFAVSLDEETKEDLKSGFWVELEFATTDNALEMHFDALLIKVVKEHTGINIIRKVNGKYQGRCFYLDLENDMSKLLSIIQKLAKNQ